MGLGLTVGYLADIAEHDPEEVSEVQQEFDWINQALSDNGLPQHNEPSSCEVWDGAGYGYSGLHALREVAALICEGKSIPTDLLLDGSQMEAGARHFGECLSHFEGNDQPSLLSRAFGKKPVAPRFIHLSLHGDAEGHYVPVDFPVPVMPKMPDADSDRLWPLGSSIALERELDALAAVLDMPSEMGSDHAGLEVAMDQPKTGADVPLWQVQPIAAYSCALLREACRKARETGAAITFC